MSHVFSPREKSVPGGLELEGVRAYSSHPEHTRRAHTHSTQRAHAIVWRRAAATHVEKCNGGLRGKRRVPQYAVSIPKRMPTARFVE